MIEPRCSSEAIALPAARRIQVALRTVSIRDLSVEADIGVNPDEIGRPQTLVLNISLGLGAIRSDRIEDTMDYTVIAERARALGTERIGLIESFAYRLAVDYLRHPGVEEADILVEKPGALSNGVARTRVVLRNL